MRKGTPASGRRSPVTVKEVTSAPSILASVKLTAGACSTSVGMLPSLPIIPWACTCHHGILQWDSEKIKWMLLAFAASAEKGNT